MSLLFAALGHPLHDLVLDLGGLVFGLVEGLLGLAVDVVLVDRLLHAGGDRGGGLPSHLGSNLAHGVVLDALGLPLLGRLEPVLLTDLVPLALPAGLELGMLGLALGFLLGQS